MDKEPKKMNYSIEPIRKILLTEAVSDGGTQEKADVLEGTWIQVNETTFAFEEEAQTTFVYNDKNEIGDSNTLEVGCACDRFKDSDKLLCEHIIAFEDLKSTPQLSIESKECRWLQEYLFSLGWYAENRYLYPSLDSPTIDPVNEDKPLDTGVDEEPEPKTYSRKCVHCEDVISGTDLAQVKQDIAEHTRGCPKNPANRLKNTPLVTHDAPEQPEVKETVTPEKPPKKEDKKVKQPSKKTGSLYDWIENLVEFGVGQIFGESGEGKTALCRELAVQVADEGKKVVYWDTEGNMTRKQRAAMTDHKNIEYILDRDWEEIRHMLPVTGEDDRTGPSIYAKTPKLKKCDLFILDSIGVPVLGIYGDLKQNEKGSALQGMQGLVYRLTTWAEKNEAVVIVTNQPVSAMNKTKAQIADRPPFGDKMKYFTKEIMKMVVAKRTDLATVCNLLTWRTRDDKRGKVLATVTISDNGVEVTPTGGE